MRTGSGPSFKHLAAALQFLRDREDVLSSRLGVVGFCMGGGFALSLALREDLAVSAPFYGQVPARADELEGVCPVVGSFGGRDAVFAPHGRRLKRHLEKLGAEHDVKVYPAAGHSFMSQHEAGALDRLYAVGPMKVAYHHESAEDAWRRMLGFFQTHLETTSESDVT